jgi:uncharacterized membrane protein YhfC
MVHIAAKESDSQKSAEMLQLTLKKTKILTFCSLIFDLCVLVFLLVSDEMDRLAKQIPITYCNNGIENKDVPLVLLRLLAVLDLILVACFLILGGLSYYWFKRKYCVQRKIV